MENCDTSISKGKAPYDPGWNDPPTFAYNSQQTPPNKPRNFLNKRIAFPLQGNATATSSPINLLPLPTTPIQGAPLPPSTSTNICYQDTIDINSESTLLEVKNILNNLLESSDLGSQAHSIKKRICAMEDMWKNGKLNKIVQKQMKDLVLALKNEKAIEADNIHKSLMVDHVSEVGTWMPGIKQIIYHYAARSELLAIEQE